MLNLLRLSRTWRQAPSHGCLPAPRPRLSGPIGWLGNVATLSGLSEVPPASGWAVLGLAGRGTRSPFRASAVELRSVFVRCRARRSPGRAVARPGFGGPRTRGPLRTGTLLLASLSGAAAFAFFRPADASPLGADWRVERTSGLTTPRAAHKVTLLSPEVALVTGGCSGVGCGRVERSAELLHYTQGISTATEPMREPRVAHGAALLQDGRVLLAGGWTGSSTTASAEIFDPRPRSFLSAQPMATARMDATATSLLDGRVLVAGGATATHRPVRQAEVFDPEKGRFLPAGHLHEARAHHAAVRLHDGRVLVLGGQRGRKQATPSAEIFDPTTGRFASAGSMSQPRCKHGAVLLRDGRVLVLGGSRDCDERQRIAETEIFDPETGRFSAGPRLGTPRYKIVDASVVLPSGEVVVAGEASEVEVWTPGTPSFVRASGTLGGRLAFSVATLLPDASVLVTGGYDDEIRPTADAWLVRREALPRQRRRVSKKRSRRAV